MKVHPVPHAIYETTMPGFIQILHHCAVSIKISQKSEILGLWSGWVKIHKIYPVIFETTSQFFLKLRITLHCQEITLPYF